jgi:ribulose 1,5-bisphosphate synthetase/thiazole synthase
MFSVRHLLLVAQSLRLVFSIHTRDEGLANATYDYIIVGGGTSGLVVANRLTEDSQSQSSLL